LSLSDRRNIGPKHPSPQFRSSLLPFLRGQTHVLKDVPFFSLFKIPALLVNSFHIKPCDQPRSSVYRPTSRADRQTLWNPIAIFLPCFAALRKALPTFAKSSSRITFSVLFTVFLQRPQIPTRPRSCHKSPMYLNDPSFLCRVIAPFFIHDQIQVRTMDIYSKKPGITRRKPME